jgi:hypothetical protein
MPVPSAPPGAVPHQIIVPPWGDMVERHEERLSDARRRVAARHRGPRPLGPATGAPPRFADHDHPAIRALATELTRHQPDGDQAVERIFLYVRDAIRFGFPPRFIDMTASETVRCGIGHCSSKTTAFRALCAAAGIPARIHAGLIDLAILRGLVPPIVLAAMPRACGHAWIEIQVGNTWRATDSYVTDVPCFEGARLRLLARGSTTGFGLSPAEGIGSCTFSFGELPFTQMGAVIEDHGTWDDLSEYVHSDRHVGLTRLQSSTYPVLAWLGNRSVARLRQAGSASGGECAPRAA